MKDQDSSDTRAVSDPPMSAAQAAYLKVLCQHAGERFDPGMSEEEATRRIAQLQEKTGRKPRVILASGQAAG